MQASNYIDGGLKRRVYLIIFPILILTNLSYWLYSSYVDKTMGYFLPILSGLLTIFCYFIYKNRYIYSCEIVLLAIFGLYHLDRVHMIAEQLEYTNVNIYIIWSPIYYVFVFLTLKKKTALIYASVILIVSFGIGVPHFNVPKAIDVLTQYYISSVIYIALMYFLKNIITVYIEANLLRKIAFYDSLTSIPNRRFLDDTLERGIQQCEMTGKSFSIIYFDIDYFKKINDTYGHEAGDHVLKEVAKIVQMSLLPQRIFGRWGGEEFLVILPYVSIEDATVIAEVLRERISLNHFQKVRHVTSSFGVAAYERGDTPKMIVKRADDALYTAKNAGRNRVKVS